MMSARLLLPVALAAVVLAACHDASDTRVTVQYVPTAGTGVEGFVATLQAAQTADTFAVLADSTPAPVFEMKTPASGFVVVTTALVDSLGPIGGGATAIELRRNATLAVKVLIDSVNPAVGCAECLGSKPLTLSAAHQRVAADSIWMVWTATSGGTSITK
jgi:hypothetical protein